MVDWTSCPHCKSALTVEEHTRSPRCPKCGKSFAGFRYRVFITLSFIFIILPLLLYTCQK
jgi:ribosomal protein L37AE/L43A